MSKFLIILFLILPLFSLSQKENSWEITWNEMVKLYEQKKIDSIIVKVAFYKNVFRNIDSMKLIYYHNDTIRYKDGKYGVGKITIDPFMEFGHRLIGTWKFYYPNGEIFSNGEYAIGAYITCQSGGPIVTSYNFNVGDWCYWYKNGKLMAKGIYRVDKIGFKNSCSSDTVSSSRVTDKWKFYNKNGNNATNKEEIVKEFTAHEFKKYNQ